MSYALNHATAGRRTSLVIDTRALGRRPGTLRTCFRRVPAPRDLGVNMAGVPEGADVELDLRLEAVVEGVLVSGTARAPLIGECARCLDALDTDIEVDLQELYAYPESGRTDEDEHQLDGDLLDLEPALRDAVVLALPLRPLCREDCPGLCPDCGARLADAPPGHSHEEPLDPRWARLQGLADPPETTHPDKSSTDDDQED